MFNLFLVEFMSPLYLFQIFSLTLWFIDEYFYYSWSATFFLTVTLLMSFYEIYSDDTGIEKMNDDEWEVIVTRQDEDGNQFDKTVHSSTLVPGDIIQVRSNINMPVDALLLSGSVIVNEGVLTGESVPVIKTELPHSNVDIYDPIKDRKYTIYAGTEILKAKWFWDDKVIALVVRSCYDTAKGTLIKNFLFPKANKYRFEHETRYYLLVCFSVSMILWLACLNRFMWYCTPWEVIDNWLNLITTLVPPTLPTAIITGTLFAIERLKKKGIYCIAPSAVNNAGRVNIMVFDKTGTMTEESWGNSSIIII
jgi:magnesium-transporting ATPase (P-type)